MTLYHANAIFLLVIVKVVLQGKKIYQRSLHFRSQHLRWCVSGMNSNRVSSRRVQVQHCHAINIYDLQVKSALKLTTTIHLTLCHYFETCDLTFEISSLSKNLRILILNICFHPFKKRRGFPNRKKNFKRKEIQFYIFGAPIPQKDLILHIYE